MKNSFLICLVLIYGIAIQFSYQQTSPFKPQRVTIGPFGRSVGTSFSFSLDTFNTLPSRIVLSHGSQGFNSIEFAYTQQIGETLKTAGTRSGAVSEIGPLYGANRIVKAEVCTGLRSGVTVIVGLRFTHESGLTQYFHGDTRSVSSFRCSNATPTTPGYYLGALSGRYGTYINQLRFTWVSNFAQEEACQADPACTYAYDFCHNYCCYERVRDSTGAWQETAFCA